MPRVKILQADTRNLSLYVSSRNLKYGPSDKMDLGLIAELNNNMLHFPRDPNSLGCLVNCFKSRALGLEYEFVKGKIEDWEFNSYDNATNKRHITWIKIQALYDQMMDEANREIDMFCFLDTDAWIRDEDGFQKFLEDFEKSSASLAIPRDLDEKDATYLNSGFLAFKNNERGRAMIEKFWTNPDYRGYWKHYRVEQRLLSDYYYDHKEDYMVLPLEDFNTPCGRVVRHCWIKHMQETSVLEEVIACFTKIAIGGIDSGKVKLGKDVVVFQDN